MPWAAFLFNNKMRTKVLYKLHSSIYLPFFLLGLCYASSVYQRKQCAKQIQKANTKKTILYADQLSIFTPQVFVAGINSLKKNNPHTTHAIAFHVRTLQNSHKFKDILCVSNRIQVGCCRCTREERRKGEQLLLLPPHSEWNNWLHFWRVTKST